MFKRFSFLIVLFIFSKQYAQFQFSGNVNTNYKHATAYLCIVDDYNKRALFLTEQILQESKIDSLGKFIFKGEFLKLQNRIYKIYINNCNENITNYKHLLNQCDDSQSILFIANNSDQIYFPLNDLSQMLCSLEYSNPQNIAINKIDSLQESLLGDLQNTKSDVQRKLIYKNHFLKLQNYSKTFNEPLVELYSFHLYANNESFSRDYYLNDLKKSKYYDKLLQKLEKNYAHTTYTNKFKEELNKDRYPLLKSKTNIFRYLTYLFGLLLLFSFGLNIFLFSKKNQQQKIIDYKTVLTSQEQKVFKLMNELSNKEIADTLFVSLSTIKTHINNIYSKLSIQSRKEIKQFFD